MVLVVPVVKWNVSFGPNMPELYEAAMSGIDAYSQGYLRQWDASATIRTRPRYRLSATQSLGDLFPAALQPLATHPAVTALGKGAVEELLVRTAYKFQSEVASIEVEVVTALCNALSVRKLHFALPESARHVALTIATDEVYHAYVAREFIADVQRLSGIEPPSLDGLESQVAKAVSFVKRTAPPEFLGEAETMALCFAENFVTDELFNMWKGVEDDNPFRTILREHLVDEGRHQKFFQNLMRHMWDRLDVAAKDALGRLLPGFLDVFLMDNATMREGAVETLGALGFDRARSLEIMAEAYAGEGDASASKHARKHVAQCTNLIRSSGMLDHAPAREALIESGWAAP